MSGSATKWGVALASVEKVALTYLAEYQKLSGVIIDMTKWCGKEETALLQNIQKKYWSASGNYEAQCDGLRV